MWVHSSKRVNIIFIIIIIMIGNHEAFYYVIVQYFSDNFHNENPIRIVCNEMHLTKTYEYQQ